MTAAGCCSFTSWKSRNPFFLEAQLYPVGKDVFFSWVIIAEVCGVITSVGHKPYAVKVFIPMGGSSTMCVCKTSGNVL